MICFGLPVAIMVAYINRFGPSDTVHAEAAAEPRGEGR
jgi:hypothetical protein